jgi:hypothetical protein
MSTNSDDERPASIQTDKESQEYGSQHGQDAQGNETGSSDPQKGAQEEGAERGGEGTGARAGEYG